MKKMNIKSVLGRMAKDLKKQAKDPYYVDPIVSLFIRFQEQLGPEEREKASRIVSSRSWFSKFVSYLFLSEYDKMRREEALLYNLNPNASIEDISAAEHGVIFQNCSLLFQQFDAMYNTDIASCVTNLSDHYTKILHRNGFPNSKEMDKKTAGEIGGYIEELVRFYGENEKLFGQMQELRFVKWDESMRQEIRERDAISDEGMKDFNEKHLEFLKILYRNDNIKLEETKSPENSEDLIAMTVEQHNSLGCLFLEQIAPYCIESNQRFGTNYPTTLVDLHNLIAERDIMVGQKNS